MKILGISGGTKNGNNDAMCKDCLLYTSIDVFGLNTSYKKKYEHRKGTAGHRYAE